MRNLIYIIIAAALAPFLLSQEDESSAAFEALSEWENVSEVMRHLYRWYLDDIHIEQISREESVECFIIPKSHELDEGDRSLFAEIYIPGLQTVVSMKRTEYVVEELALEVSSDSFKIVNIERVDGEYPSPPRAIGRSFPFDEMRDYLFRTRHQQDPPSPELLGRLRESVRRQLAKHGDAVSHEGPQTVFISPISPVANEIWAYWLEAQLLIRLHSDIDIAHPAVWDHEQLMVDILDIEEQVVLSFSHVPGSNAYLTRDRVGRILYNCTVLGQKLVLAGE